MYIFLYQRIKDNPPAYMTTYNEFKFSIARGGEAKAFRDCIEELAARATVTTTVRSACARIQAYATRNAANWLRLQSRLVR